ncbi:hypothetical protein AAY473_006203 [Plecturocebus cupreus]
MVKPRLLKNKKIKSRGNSSRESQGLHEFWVLLKKEVVQLAPGPTAALCYSAPHMMAFAEGQDPHRTGLCLLCPVSPASPLLTCVAAGRKWMLWSPIELWGSFCLCHFLFLLLFPDLRGFLLWLLHG